MIRSLHAMLGLVCVPFLIAGGGYVAAKEVKTLEIGQSAPDFTLPGVDDRDWGLKDFADAKVLVVVFTCNHCPTAQAYEDRIIAMHADYQDKGVALVAISPNNAEAVRLDELGYTDLGDSLADMKLRARQRDFKFPYLYDGETQRTSTAFGVLATPHVFIFDRQRKLCYAGRIDDSDVKTPKSHDARNAIDALLTGQPVPVETTRVFGCSTKWLDKRASAEQSLAKWNQEKATLEPIDAQGVKTLAANDTKKLRLVNVWATYCGPCVAEMDEFVTMHRMYRRRNFELVTISLDNAAAHNAALGVLNEKHVSATNFRYDGDDKDALAEALDKKWAGPLPYTLLIAPGGKIIYRHGGEIEPLEVKRAIVDYLGRTY